MAIPARCRSIEAGTRLERDASVAAIEAAARRLGADAGQALALVADLYSDIVRARHAARGHS